MTTASSELTPTQSVVFPRRHHTSRAPSIAASDTPSVSTQMSLAPLLVPIHTLPSRPSTSPKRPTTSSSLRSLPKNLSISNLFVRKTEKKKPPSRPWTSREVPPTLHPSVATTTGRPATADSAKRPATGPSVEPLPPPAVQSPPRSPGPINRSNTSVSPFDHLNPVPINQQPVAMSPHQDTTSKPTVQPIASKEQISLWLTTEIPNHSAHRSQESLISRLSPVTSRSTSSLTTTRPRTASSTSNQIDVPRAPIARGRSPIRGPNTSCPPPPRASTGTRQRPSTANEVRKVPPNWVSGLDHRTPRPKTATHPSHHLGFRPHNLTIVPHTPLV